MIKTQTIKDFSRGIANDIRTEDTRKAQLVKNFDIHTYKHKLLPNISSGNGDSSASTHKIQNFAVAEYTDGSYRQFGLGVASGGNKAKIFVNSNLNSSIWNARTNGEDPTDEAVDFELFTYYKETEKIYFARNGDTIVAVDPTDSSAVADDHTLATNYNNPRESDADNRPYISGLVHPQDKILYIAYDNIIISNNNGAWTDPVLTLPKSRIITSLSEYGNYLAIATKSVDEVGNSKVYLWNRDATLNTISEIIDWGEGNLQVLEEIGGMLVGVSSSGTNATVLYSRFTFRYYAGGEPVTFKQLVSEDVYLLSDLSRVSRKVSDYLYFYMKLKIGGTTEEGIWKLGKHIRTGEMVLSLAYPLKNDTALTNSELHNFIINGDSVFMSFTNNGAIEMTWINGGSSTYTASSVWETIKLYDDQSQTKKLEGITVMFEPLPTDAKVTLKYRKDEETSWTTIFSDFTTDNAIRHSAINIESSGDNLPQYKEIQFQVISTGNAVITGLKYKYSIIKDDIYE